MEINMADNIKKRQHALSPVEEARQIRDETRAAAEAASEKETSFLSELSSTKSILTGGAALAALLAGGTGAAAGLAARGVFDAEEASRAKNAKFAESAIAAAENYYDATEKVIAAEQEQIKNNVTMMTESDGAFIEAAIAGGMENVEINHLLGIFDENATIDWGMLKVAKNKQTAINKIMDTLLAEIQDEPDKNNRVAMWRNVLSLPNMPFTEGEVRDLSESLAVGGQSFENYIAQLAGKYYPDSVREASVVFNDTGDLSAALRQLKALPVDKEKDDELIRLTMLVDDASRSNAVTPLEAVEFIEDDRDRAAAKNRFEEMGFPGSQEEFDIYSTFLLKFTQMEEDVNIKNALIDQPPLPEGWAEARARDGVLASRDIRRRYINLGIMNENDKISQVISYPIGSPEYNNIRSNAFNAAVLLDPDGATIDHMRKAKELIESKGEKEFLTGIPNSLELEGTVEKQEVAGVAMPLISPEMARLMPATEEQQVVFLTKLFKSDPQKFNVTEDDAEDAAIALLATARAMLKKQGAIPLGINVAATINKLLSE